MKVYRFPFSNPELLNLTDEQNLQEKEIDLYSNNKLELDITIDKDGDRHSGVYLSFEKSDLKAFFDLYIKYLNSENEDLIRKNQEHKNNEHIHLLCWGSIEAAFSELNFSLIDTDEFIRYCKNLASKLKYGLYDEIDLNSLKKYEIEFEDILLIDEKYSPSKSLNYIKKIYSNYTNDFHLYIADLCDRNRLRFSHFLDNFEDFLKNSTDLKQVMSSINDSDEEVPISPADLFKGLFEFIKDQIIAEQGNQL